MTTTELNKTDIGVEFSNVKLIGFAVVKTFRLIQDNGWVDDEMDMDEKH